MKLTHHRLQVRAALWAARLLVCATLLGGLQACSVASWLISRPASGTTAESSAEPPPAIAAAMPSGRVAGNPPANLVADDGHPGDMASTSVAAASVAMATVGAPPADEPETAPAVSPRVAPVGGLTPVDESGRPPAEAAAPELTLLPISTDLPKGHFAVRIGLFSDESNAYRQAATLRDVVWTHQDLLPEERAIRVLKPDSRFIVLLGDLADAQAARQLVSKIRRLLHRESIIYTR